MEPMLAMLNNLALSNLLADVGGSFWMPPQASQTAIDVDWLFYFILAISVFFFLLILVILVAFVIKYRHREGEPVLDAPKHNTALELTWTFIPTVLVVIIFVYGFKGYMRMSVPPPDAYPIDVTAHMWDFGYTYPNGTQVAAKELTVPVNRPIEFIMTSNDVIHGFYMPVFRVKKDIVPGRYHKIWIMPTVPGVYDIYCTQYCGQDHSSMRGKITVVSKAEFDTWLASKSTAGMTPAEKGKRLYTINCQSCHSIDGSYTGKAPTWKGLYMTQVITLDGTNPIADENYLRRAITRPNSMPLPGFTPAMPNFPQLTDTDIQNIIEFIKSLGNHPPAAAGAGSTSATVAPTTQPMH
jgi:cytochrome c oxidase subunit II